jgi:Ca2+-binding EF-hand superfamily protein
VAEAFLRADGNRDGALSRAEAGTLGPVRQSFEEMDTNKDGQLSRSEFEAGAL